MSASRRSANKSDTTSIGKARSTSRGKSSVGPSKDTNASRRKTSQPKQTTFTPLIVRNQQKIQGLTPEERELFESALKSMNKSGVGNLSVPSATKSVTKGHKTPSPAHSVASKRSTRSAKPTVLRKTGTNSHLKPKQNVIENKPPSTVKSAPKSPRSPKSPGSPESEEKMVIEEADEEKEVSDLGPVDLSVPDPISGFIRDTQGRLTPRSDIFSFEGKSVGKSAKKIGDVSPFDERIKSSQKKLGSNTRKLPSLLDSVLEDSDYEIQINITQIDEEVEMSQDLRGKEFRDSSNQKKGEKRMLKELGSSGGVYWGIGDLGRQDSTDEPVRRRIANKENEIVQRKVSEEDLEGSREIIRVIVPDGVEDEEESQVVRNSRGNAEEKRKSQREEDRRNNVKEFITVEDEREGEGDEERKIRENVTSHGKLDLFSEVLDIMDENKDLIEGEGQEDIQVRRDEDRSSQNVERMEEEETTQRRKNVSEVFNMLVGDESQNTEDRNIQSSQQRKQVAVESIEEERESGNQSPQESPAGSNDEEKESNRGDRMQEEKETGRDEVTIEEEPMTGAAKAKEIAAEIARERNLEAQKSSENEESDEPIEKIGELAEIEDLRSPGHTENSEDEMPGKEVGKVGAKGTGDNLEEDVESDDIDKLQNLEEIKDIEEDPAKANIDKEFEVLEQEEGFVENIEDSEVEKSPQQESEQSENKEAQEKRSSAREESHEENEEIEEEGDNEEENEMEQEDKLFESNQEAHKLLNDKVPAYTATQQEESHDYESEEQEAEQEEEDEEDHEPAESSPKEAEPVEKESEIEHEHEEEEFEVESESEAERGVEKDDLANAEAREFSGGVEQDIVSFFDYVRQGGLDRVEEQKEEESSVFLGSQKNQEDSLSQFLYSQEKEEEEHRSPLQKKVKVKVEKEGDQEWRVDEEEEKEAADQEEEDEENITRQDTGQRYQARPTINVQESGRKEYTAYEDWRILEAVRHLQLKGGSGLRSIKTWETIKDPMTGQRLLNGERTAESMRNRVKRTLDLLEDDEIEQIREYMKTHSEQEARRHYCRFEKDKSSGQKVFKGIFSEQNYNPQNITKKNNNGQDSSRMGMSVSRVIESRRRNVGVVQNEFERDLEDDIEDVDLNESILTSRIQRQIERPQELLNSRVSTNTVVRTTREKTSAVNNEGKLYIFEEKGKTTAYKVMPYHTTIKKAPREVNQREILRPDAESSNQSLVRRDPGKTSNKKRKEYDDKELNGRHNCDLKKVKQNIYFEQKSLMVSDAFKTRKPLEMNIAPKDDLIIFLDLEEGFRQFVQDKDRLAEESQQGVLEKISLLAAKYKVQYQKIGVLFNQVSCDLEDLELYLKTKRSSLLWDGEEDQDLLTGDQTGLRYLRQVKGDERMEKRRRYLMNSCFKRGDWFKIILLKPGIRGELSEVDIRVGKMTLK